MKNNKYSISSFLLLLGLTLIFSACKRELSDDAVIATFPKNGDVYIDGFSAGLEYLPFGDSFFAAFSVDDETKYDGTSAMRFDVPNVGDPSGAYSGAIFPDYGGRDLSDFDALTFWAKASKKGTINAIGFGLDFRESPHQVTLENLELSTNWRQYTIAIPDPAKLTQEKGLFWYAEGPENDEGYTFWIDELQFEKLGTVAQSRPSIFNGLNAPIQTFAGVTTPVSGLTQTVNLGNGQDQTIIITPGYFEFTSSNPSVATVNERGMITAVSMGEAVITATLGGVDAKGSATVTVTGDFETAPIPTQDPSNVISIFSDAYTNEPVDYYNGYWVPDGQTTLGQDDININGDNIIAYTELNFVGIQFFENAPTINASSMTRFHVDVQPREDIGPGDFLKIIIADVGPDNEFGTGDDSSGEITITNSDLTEGEWYSLDVAFSELAGLTGRSNLAQVVFVSDATISNIYVDNIYFYDDGGSGPTEPNTAAPTPTQGPADVISVFSDAYTNINSNLNPDWGQATQFSEVSISGNNTLRYGGLDYQGLELESSIDVTSMDFLHIDYWTANSSALNAFLISTSDEMARALTVPSSGWESVDIPLGDFSPVDLADVIQLKFDGNGDIYLDNIYFHNGSGGGNEPTTAAPTPTQDAADVISLFSNAYTDVGVDTWKTDWSVVTLEDIQIQGDDTKKYTDLDFVGVETTGGNLIDASSMTHFRMDIWTPNMTTFRIKLVDFGPDGTFEGGDDSEHELVFDNPAQGQWVSYDIPLSDFTGLTSTAHMAQYIFSGLPAGGGTLYVDNVYFYQQ